MSITRRLRIIGFVLFIGGFLLTYFNWWINDYMPTVFFIILGFISWVLGITIYYSNKDRTFQKVFIAISGSLAVFFILTFTTQSLLLKNNYSYIRAHLFSEPVKGCRSYRAINDYVTSIYYKAGAKEIKKGFVGADYLANDFVLIRYANAWPEIYETVAKVPDSLTLVDDMVELATKMGFPK